MPGNRVTVAVMAALRGSDTNETHVAALDARALIARHGGELVLQVAPSPGTGPGGAGAGTDAGAGAGATEPIAGVFASVRSAIACAVALSGAGVRIGVTVGETGRAAA